MCIACEMGFCRHDRRARRRRSARAHPARAGEAARFACEPRRSRDDARQPSRAERMSASRERTDFAHAGRGARRAEARKASPPPNLPTRISPRSRRRARSMPMCWRRRSAPPRWRRPPTRASPKAKPGRSKAFRSPSRTCSAPQGVRIDRLLAHPRQFRADLRVDRDRASCGATARCCSARPTTTSSPWARRTRPRISGR